MKIIKVKNYDELSEKAFQIVKEQISKKPNSVIGFATGKTPIKLYQKLSKAYKNNNVDFSKIKTFNLDELYPMKQTDKRSYYRYMFKNLFSKINVKKENINLLNGGAKSPSAECKNYENKIQKNSIDLQILGLGANAHIGFNEPGSSPNSKTHLVNLTEETAKVKKNSRALTMGISTIMKSKKIILLASGGGKSKAVHDLIKGKISKDCPASFLRKHRNIFVIIDEKASSLL